jgi:ATP synthase subunit C
VLDRRWERAVDATDLPADPAQVDFRTPEEAAAGARPAVSPWHGIGLVGAKAAEAVGRNPGAFGRVLTLSILGMALAESIAIYALILAFQRR